MESAMFFQKWDKVYIFLQNCDKGFNFILNWSIREKAVARVETWLASVKCRTRLDFYLGRYKIILFSQEGDVKKKKQTLFEIFRGKNWGNILVMHWLCMDTYIWLQIETTFTQSRNEWNESNCPFWQNLFDGRLIAEVNHMVSASCWTWKLEYFLLLN